MVWLSYVGSIHGRDSRVVVLDNVVVMLRHARCSLEHLGVVRLFRGWWAMVFLDGTRQGMSLRKRLLLLRVVVMRMLRMLLNGVVWYGMPKIRVGSSPVHGVGVRHH